LPCPVYISCYILSTLYRLYVVYFLIVLCFINLSLKIGNFLPVPFTRLYQLNLIYMLSYSSGV
jgi:hypothetical protein